MKDLEYVTLKKGNRQYDNIDYQNETYVNAVYVKSDMPIDNGNQYVEALPKPRQGDDVELAYTKQILDYDYNKIMALNDNEKLYSVSMLRQLRYPLPFHEELELECYSALINSYRARYVRTDIDSKIIIQINGQDEVIHSVVYGDENDAANVGFSLLGYSGCGKSSSLKILLSNYPQVIMHQENELTRRPQIVYLVVNCIANSNFSALYVSIGSAIDKALGNINPCYSLVIEKKRSLGEKAEKVRQLIEIFAIGIIIFDEIQLIDFSTTKENSFESLMTLCNKTKVAIAVVGTEDAFDKMFPKLRTSRRLGTFIYGHKYCDDYNYFNVIVNNLFKYQWFEKRVSPTVEMKKTLFDYSKGIIDQLISIYIYMQIDYIKAKTKPTVNSEFISNTVNKHFPGIQEVLKFLNDPIMEKKRTEINKNIRKDLDNIFDNNQKIYTNKIIEDYNSGKITNIEILKKKVIKNIQIYTDAYNNETIEKNINNVISGSSTEEFDETFITRETLKRLQNGKTDRRPKEKKPKKIKKTQEEVLEFLENK